MLTISEKVQERLQEKSYKIVEAIQVICGTNVQWAHDPKTDRDIVIEINPRTSRSSALASKATGFPIALVSAMLATGLTLDELPCGKYEMCIRDRMTTVISVEVTPDLKYCKAYISVLGNEEAGKDTIQGLRSAVGFIRTQLARKINLRNTPELTFILDQSIEYGVNMTRLINEVTAGLGESEADGEENGAEESQE